LSLDILTFSVDELEDKIKTVGFTGHYRENIEQASEIFHRRPQMPAQRASTFSFECFVLQHIQHVLHVIITTYSTILNMIIKNR
jgi:hypothetical protein